MRKMFRFFDRKGNASTARRYVGIAGILAMSAMFGCLDPYMPPTSETEAATEFLVIDALLNTTQNSCEVKLNRTIPLDHKDTTVYEDNAFVQVTVSDGSGPYILQQTGPGLYVGTGIPVDPSKKYSILIGTTDGNQYVSDAVEAKTTPPLDSVSWKTEGKDNFYVYANTHDDSRPVGYYRWRFAETWTYHSAFYSQVKYENGEIHIRDTYENIYNCWGNDRSSEILVASTDKLESNRISEFQLLRHDIGDEKLQSRYSIIVRQYSITKEAFDYWKLLEKNTENLGTLFDPQPSQVTGNFRCVNNPALPVLGFFTATSVAEKRIFISRRQLPQVKLYTQYDNCEQDLVLLAQLSTHSGLLIAPISSPAGILIGYSRSSTFCVDCRESGGTTIKPDFWE